jgi:hypothetical protein
VSGLVLFGDATSDSGVDTRTFLADGLQRFSSKGTRQRATELVVHDSVTRSVDATVSVLQQRGLGVHLILGPDGVFYQYGDLGDVLWHAGPVHNHPSIGVEVVNPYYPRLLRSGLPWERVIDAPWADEGRYVLPTPAQAEAISDLVRWTTSSPARGVEVPRSWPGLRGGCVQLGVLDDAVEAPLPGVLAHHYFGHSDGAWLVLYAWLRLEARLPPGEAFEQAARRASGASSAAAVRDLLPGATAA